jgi:hypothetical protein
MQTLTRCPSALGGRASLLLPARRASSLTAAPSLRTQPVVRLEPARVASTGADDAAKAVRTGGGGGGDNNEKIGSVGMWCVLA